MDETLLAHVQAQVRRLQALSAEGARLRTALASAPPSPEALARLRLWQTDCGGIVNELSGGSKSHWLARAFSHAFLILLPGDSSGESPAPEANPARIVGRLLDVIDQARRSLAILEEGGPAVHSAAAQDGVHRFDFVTTPELRPSLEQAYRDGLAAFDRGDFLRALVSASSILEAVITDALERTRPGPDAPPGPIGQWSFGDRIAAAERMRLISAGCSRLPPSARSYRDLLDERGEPKADEATVTSRDARLARQVLHVIMRDLAPGR